MAIFTPVTEADARRLLAHYDLGEYVSLHGIAAGIENTNYFLTTTRGEYVLTLFEVLTHEQLPFYLALMHHLAQRGIPVPSPQALQDGSRQTQCLGKPTAIVTRLPGRDAASPGAAHCARIADMQARAHLAAQDFPMHQPNLRGLDWWQATVPQLLPFLSPSQTTLIQTVLDEQTRFAASDTYRALPRGAQHCDLFRDNVLFEGPADQPRLGGIIDYYFAGCDAWLFDVAVAVNDWCVDLATGAFDAVRLRAWLAAYAAQRPFTDAERQAWPTLLQAAALRFWVSRLYDFHLPRAAQTLTPHDPGHFERVLLARRTNAAPALP